MLERVLAAFDPRGDVVELACGTGLWTRHLVGYADALTAVDGSAEVLAINRARVGSETVRYIEADLFSWTAPGAYDACVFSFWLSHVPQQRFAAFWEMVARRCGPVAGCCSSTAPAPTAPRPPTIGCRMRTRSR